MSKEVKPSGKEDNNIKIDVLPTPNEIKTMPQTGNKTNFPIVGIGASAGGLEAFEQFFANMPTNSGMAFVLVQHLSAPHKSILEDLISRYTEMPVQVVQDGLDVKPNNIYIIPPNKDMALLNGTLHLLEPDKPRGLRLPIDYFFRSLAQDKQNQAIGIVLSGTGSDGTLGTRAIIGVGGMVMVEDPDFAKYDGMPRSAINTGLVDFILPPNKMPEKLISFIHHAFNQEKTKEADHTMPPSIDSMQKIFILLRGQTGHDFSLYKQNTIRRRIERRMTVNQIQGMHNYVKYLQRNPMEVETLFRELLIGVTSFFRDPEAFATLEEQVIPKLMADKTLKQPIRIWVPGCSTGEEAYSLAMLFHEYMSREKLSHSIQIFATDIDHEAIDKARAGVFPDGIVADVSTERLKRFFTQENSAYHIKKTIRDMVVFAAQNVISDPPFSKLDLISCRNLLIYLGPELQKKVLPMFHYALNQDKFLMLGNSETVGEFTNLFAVLDRKWKVFQRKGAVPLRRPLVGFSAPSAMEGVVFARNLRKGQGEDAVSVRDFTERYLLENQTPTTILINEKCDILYIHGRTGKFLEPAAGEASFNVLKMARKGLRMELTTAVRKVISQRQMVQYKELPVRTNGDTQPINLTVQPVLAPPSMKGLMLVILEELLPLKDEDVENSSDNPETDKDRQISRLERELQAKEEYLQTTIEELETSNEELKSTNEELQSSNEELQSTNEEMETSKEELQSVNEELVTVNAELQQKLEELSRANNDMNNLMASTQIGTIFLDFELRVQRFTPSVTNIINLIQTDIGRPVRHIVSNLKYEGLVEDAQQVLDNLIPQEREVETKEGSWKLMRIMPYRTVENVIEGVVITFVDISEQKKVQMALQETAVLRRLAIVVHDSNDAITVQDFEGQILAWNPGAVRIYGWSESEALAMNIRDIVPKDKRQEALDFIRQLANEDEVESFSTQRVCKDGRILDIWLTVTKLIDKNGKLYAVATTEHNVTKR